jgi:hypothetical protein
VEVLELVELLAGGGKLDRLAGDRLDRERRATACVAVELRQDDAVEVHALLERLGDRNGFLAGHRVEDEEHVVRRDRLPHGCELLHERLVDLEAPGGVDDDDVAALCLGLLEPVLRDRDRVLCRPVQVDRDLDLLAELLELVDRSRPLEVGGHEGGRLRLLLAEKESQLRRRGRLSRSLQAGEEDHGRRPTRKGELGPAGAHELRQLLMDDPHDFLAGRQALRHGGAARALANAADEVLHHFEVDVGLEQGEADLAHRPREILLREDSAAAQITQRALQLV